MNEKIKRLSAFDWDGTLGNSPMPDTGRIEWKEKTGEDYPHKGWWGRPESLSLDVFNIKPFPTVLAQLNDEKAKPNTYVIVLTSRLEKLRPQLQAVLDVNNIHVDKVDMKFNEKTKGEKILDYINEFPNLEEISVFDDRDVDINGYLEIKNQIPEKIRFNIYRATDGKIALVENKLNVIINEEIENFFEGIYNKKI